MRTDLIAWIAPDKTTLESGCVKFIPGTHKRGFITHIASQGETRHDRRPGTAPVEGSSAIYAGLEPGDAVIFNMRLVHGGDEVQTVLAGRGRRIAYPGFSDPMSAPRGCPIAVRGGTPESPATRFRSRRRIEKRSWALTMIESVGQGLSKLGDISTAEGC